jgi:hypothetical protein
MSVLSIMAIVLSPSRTRHGIGGGGMLSHLADEVSRLKRKHAPFFCALEDSKGCAGAARGGTFCNDSPSNCKDVCKGIVCLGEPKAETKNLIEPIRAFKQGKVAPPCINYNSFGGHFPVVDLNVMYGVPCVSAADAGIIGSAAGIGKLKQKDIVYGFMLRSLSHEKDSTRLELYAELVFPHMTPDTTVVLGMDKAAEHAQRSAAEVKLREKLASSLAAGTGPTIVFDTSYDGEPNNFWTKVSDRLGFPS